MARKNPTNALRRSREVSGSDGSAAVAITSSPTSAFGRRRARIAAALLAAALFAASAAWVFSVLPEGAATSADHAPVARTAASSGAQDAGGDARPHASQGAPAASSWGMGYRVGESLTYSYEHARSITMTAAIFGGLAGDEAPPEPLDFSVTVRGRLRVSVYAEDADVWTLGFRLDDARLRMRSSEAAKPDRTSDLEREMHEEVLVSIERTGRMCDFVVPESMSAEASNFWRDLLAAFQVQLTEDAGADTWTALESDTTGEYVATYRRSGRANPTQIVKSKGEYVRLHGQTERPERIAFDASATIELARVVRSIHATERLSLSNHGSAIESDVEIAFELVDQSTDASIARRAPAILDALRDADRQVIGAGTEPVAEDDGAAPVEAIGPLLDELASLLQDGGAGSSGEAAIMARIVDLIRRDPKVVASILERLRSSDASDDLAAVLLGALGAAGTGAAQDGLVEVFSSSDWTESRRFTALTALAQVEEPTAVVFEELEQLRAEGIELSKNALLLLGAMGSRVRASDPGRFDAIRDQLIELASTEGRATDFETRREILILEAVKNLRLDTTPDVVEELYRTGDDFTRLEAVDYLEYTYDQRANDVLFRALAQDPSETIRASAAAEIPQAARGIELDVIEGIATNDPSIEVRKAIVNALAERARDDQGAVDVLASIAETNDSPEVRELAAAAIES